MCSHNEVILSILLMVVVVMFCKIKVFLVRCIGCSIEESFSRPAFREDLTTNVKKGVSCIKFSFSFCFNFPLIYML